MKLHNYDGPDETIVDETVIISDPGDEHDEIIAD